MYLFRRRGQESGFSASPWKIKGARKRFLELFVVGACITIVSLAVFRPNKAVALAGISYAQVAVNSSGNGPSQLDIWRNASLARTTLQWDGDSSYSTVVTGNTVTKFVDGAVQSVESFDDSEDEWGGLTAEYGVTQASVNSAISSGQVVASEPAAATYGATVAISNGQVVASEPAAVAFAATAATTSESPTAPLGRVGPTGAVGPTGVDDPIGGSGTTCSGCATANTAATSIVAKPVEPHVVCHNYGHSQQSLYNLQTAFDPIPLLTSIPAAPGWSGAQLQRAALCEFYGPGKRDSGPYASISYGQTPNEVTPTYWSSMLTVDVVPQYEPGWGQTAWERHYKDAVHPYPGDFVVRNRAVTFVGPGNPGMQAVYHATDGWWVHHNQGEFFDGTFICVTASGWVPDINEWSSILEPLSNSYDEGQ